MSSRAWVSFGALLLGACSMSVDVVGRVDPGEELYYGTATSDGQDGGRIDMATADGKHCIGEYRFNGGGRMGLLPVAPSGGLARLVCNDGRTAGVRFNSLSVTSGYGYGRASDGSAVRFAFGMTEAEAAPHLGSRPATDTKRPGGTGTGFFVGSAGEIMTNHHVAGNCTAVTAQTADGVVHEARVLANDAVNDLALVKIDVASPAALSFYATPTYRPGDRAITYGFPLTGTLTDSGNLTSGDITALSGRGNDSRMLQMSVPVQPGNSGGPLVDDRGVVVGVVKSKLNALYVAAETGDIPQNANFAVKEVFARTFMQANGVAPKSAGDGRPRLSTADIGDQLRAAVVHLTCHGD